MTPVERARRAAEAAAVMRAEGRLSGASDGACEPPDGGSAAAYLDEARTRCRCCGARGGPSDPCPAWCEEA